MSGMITIVGTGPGPINCLTREAETVLTNAKKVFMRTNRFPVFGWLKEQGKIVVCFDLAYDNVSSGYTQVYAFIVATLLKDAQRGNDVVYTVPGNPYVYEKTTKMIRTAAAEAGISCRIVHGMSFLDFLYVEVGINPSKGLQTLNAIDMINFPGAAVEAPWTEKLDLLIAQFAVALTPDPDCKESNARAVMERLLKRFPENHACTAVWSSGPPDHETRSKQITIGQLAKEIDWVSDVMSLHVPALHEPWQ